MLENHHDAMSLPRLFPLHWPLLLLTPLSAWQTDNFFPGFFFVCLFLLLLYTTFKVLIQFVTILFLFYVFFFFFHQNAFGMWASQVAQW